jgi:hypothetical protein
MDEPILKTGNYFLFRYCFSNGQKNRSKKNPGCKKSSAKKSSAKKSSGQKSSDTSSEKPEARQFAFNFDASLLGKLNCFLVSFDLVWCCFWLRLVVQNSVFVFINAGRLYCFGVLSAVNLLNVCSFC